LKDVIFEALEVQGLLQGLTDRKHSKRAPVAAGSTAMHDAEPRTLKRKKGAAMSSSPPTASVWQRDNGAVRRGRQPGVPPRPYIPAGLQTPPCFLLGDGSDDNDDEHAGRVAAGSTRRPARHGASR
jgi:hypothetical protein